MTVTAKAAVPVTLELAIQIELPPQVGVRHDECASEAPHRRPHRPLLPCPPAQELHGRLDMHGADGGPGEEVPYGGRHLPEPPSITQVCEHEHRRLHHDVVGNAGPLREGGAGSGGPCPQLPSRDDDAVPFKCRGRLV